MMGATKSLNSRESMMMGPMKSLKSGALAAKRSGTFTGLLNSEDAELLEEELQKKEAAAEEASEAEGENDSRSEKRRSTCRKSVFELATQMISTGQQGHVDSSSGKDQAAAVKNIQNAHDVRMMILNSRD